MEKSMLNRLFDEKLQSEMMKFFLNELSPLGTKEIFEKDCFVKHDDPNYIYIVTNGCFKQMVYSVHGKEISLFRLGPGTIFGEMDYFDKARTIAITKTLEDESSVSKISRNILEAELTKNPEIYRFFIHSITRKYRIIAMNKINALSNDSMGKIAGFMLELLAQYGNDANKPATIPYIYTHKEIASSLGVSRITVTNVINELRNLGVISYSGKNIVVEDPHSIRQIYNSVW